MANNLNWLIKKISMDAYRASKPCDIITGVVAEGKPLRIKISDKTTLDDDFLMITQSAFKANLVKGDKVALIRACGGQKYLVIDKVVRD
ncbi:MAG: DUF2577 domain-containing protein [Eubacterium sp.]|nr:DUF2577 domain-containing protein [Eubacterium sp.]